MMKKIAGLFGLISGIGAVVWVMRDRLISLTAAPDPEPPQFRSVSSTDGHRPPPAAKTHGDDLQVVRGIGPVYEQALHAYGVRTFASLAEIDAADLASHIGIPEPKVASWVKQASELAT